MTFANVEVKSLKNGVTSSILMISKSTLVPRQRVMKYKPGIIIRKIDDSAVSVPRVAV